MHASLLATLYNAHFDHKGIPWTPEDLMGTGDREKRKIQRFKAKLGSALAGRRKPAPNSDSDPDARVPEWIRNLATRRVQ